jgi:hypothetical protein
MGNEEWIMMFHRKACAQSTTWSGSGLENETRYSPARGIGCDMKVVSGKPDPKHVSTSFVERQNLSMRMSIRRFTRLTNAFSKKLENHAAAVALWFMYYNFCRVHSTLRVTPAMEAGICDHVWGVEELCDLLPENHKIGVQTDKGLILKALGEQPAWIASMNDRPMAAAIVGLALAGFLYVFFNPAAVKSANETARYRWVGFGKKPIWFFRAIGAAGSIISGFLLLQIILWKR